MTFDFFEGPAGTGKTHNALAYAEELTRRGVLLSDSRLLALTFMNGARLRLDGRLRDNSLLRRRFSCQTFDVFGRMVAGRRRSLVSWEHEAEAETLNAFDGPCFLAGRLLELPMVRQWVARSFPLVMVDEAQDLDEHRLRILQNLAKSCSVVVAADAFQCLRDGHDTARLMKWLEGTGRTQRLESPMRTNQRGLLKAAQAVRTGANIREVLHERTSTGRTMWVGPGFRLFEVAGRASLLAWNISNQIAQTRGPIAVLTPDSRNRIVRSALDIVHSREWIRKNGGRFGPYPLVWDQNDTEEANQLLSRVTLPESVTYGELHALLEPLAEHPPATQTISRMDRIRRVQGLQRFSAVQIEESIRDSVRNQFRFALRKRRRRVVMTIHRAKNQEFANVIVVWPHSVTGGSEHLRRLLYNSISRAKDHCCVIVLGKNRLDKPPFIGE